MAAWQAESPLHGRPAGHDALSGKWQKAIVCPAKFVAAREEMNG
jgi:hypothetical protein